MDEFAGGAAAPVRFVVVLGVSASGKTTVGKRLAVELGWPFHEGDDFHPPENISKMKRGIPLTDDDRRPWLLALQGMIEAALARGENGVLACSALKKEYRDILRVDARVRFVFLDAGVELIRRRMSRRTGHFMPAALAESQFETLEVPENALRVDAASAPANVIRAIRKALSL